MDRLRSPGYPHLGTQGLLLLLLPRNHGQQGLGMSAPADSLISTSKGNKMYLVTSNENVLASCETHDMAFMFFEAFGGFSYPNLQIEIERED